VRSARASRRRSSASRPVALAVGLALLAAAAGAEPSAPSFEAVMDRFARSRGVEASFREEKSLPLLVEPLVSEGVLYYAPPGRMVRFTHSPEATSLLLDGDRLRMQDSLGVEEIDLSSHPEARQFVDQLRVLFRGDADALRERYEIDFAWRGGPWSLRLTPRSLRVKAVIEEIELSGRERRLEQMLVKGAAGELTRTRYLEVDPDRAFRPEELDALFPGNGAPRPLAGPADPTRP
jgi:outer membrane lipoprotein-sorting protein